MTQLTLKLQNDSEAIGEMKTLFSPVASLDHANPTHLPENGKAKRMNAIYGQKCLESFGKFSHVGSWAKMFSDLLIGMEGWSSTKCRLTWRLKGTKYNRMYFQLQPSTLPTEGIEFGLLLLKTPSAMDAYAENLSKKEQKFGNSGTLAQEIATGFVNNRIPRLLPTPATRDYKGARSEESLREAGRNHTNSLPDAFAQPGTTSQLSPQFTLEMMGFPTNWTELPFQSGDKNP